MINKRIIEEEKDTPEKREFKKRVKDWGLRHSTLEEVFIRVRNKNTFSLIFINRYQSKVKSLIIYNKHNC